MFKESRDELKYFPRVVKIKHFKQKNFGSHNDSVRETAEHVYVSWDT